MRGSDIQISGPFRLKTKSEASRLGLIFFECKKCQKALKYLAFWHFLCYNYLIE